MSMRNLETAILAEAKIVTDNKKLRMKDITEWSTGEIQAQSGEKLYFLPTMQVNIVVKEKL